MCITCRSNVGEHTLSKVGDTLGSTNRLVPETAPLPQRNTIFASQIGESHFFFLNTENSRIQRNIANGNLGGK